MRFAEVAASTGSLADAVRLACEWEVCAPKLGNVHPQSAFSDCNHHDFLRAALAVAPILGSIDQNLGIGDRVHQAVLATREVTSANVNLGIILLIAPLAAINEISDLRSRLECLEADAIQSQRLFDGIRLAGPGGMKQSDVAAEHDVESAVTIPMGAVSAMRLAAHRDRIARQYADGYSDFFNVVVPLVQRFVLPANDLMVGIVDAQIALLAQEVDSLIQRKCGEAIAKEAQARAQRCLENPTDEQRREFDAWLRADGHRRNPGTTADLLAAALYWLLRMSATTITKCESSRTA